MTEATAGTAQVTFCRICEAGCGLLADVREGQVTKLRPDPDHVVSRGYACVKGIRYTELHASPDRVIMPLKRVGERFEPISWADALREIGERVRRIRAAHGDQSIGMYVGNPSAFSLLHPVFAQLFLASLGSRNLFTSGSQDCNNKFVVSEAMYGSALIQPVPDIDQTQCLIIIGSNPAVSHMSFMQLPRPVERLKAIEKRGGHVVLINPRRTETAEQLGEQVFIRPNTDVYFLLSFAREVLARVSVPDAIVKQLDGLETLRSLTQEWTPEATAQLTGISADKTRELVAIFLAADGAALYCSTGVNQGSQGTLACWLLQAVNLLSGNVDRQGGLLIPQAQIQNGKTVKRMSRGIAAVPSRIGGFQPVLGSYPAGILADEIETAGAGQIRAMFVSAGNPVLSCPSSARIERALSGLDLLVSIDLFRNETGNLAHYILPVTSFLEREDVPLSAQGFQPLRYLQHCDRVVAPAGQTKDEWSIFSELARACGTRLFGSRLLQMWLEASTDDSWLPAALRFSPRLAYHGVAVSAGTSLGSVRKQKHGKLLAQTKPHSFLGKQVLRPGKRVDLAPKAFVDAARALAVPPAPGQRTPNLLLITQRTKTSHNSWMHNVESFVRGPRGTNYLTMHSADAQERGLSAGSLVQISSKTGRVRLPLHISDEVMPGVVALPHGWGHAQAAGLTIAKQTRGQNANLLTPDGPDAIEALSGMAQLTGIAVDVEACGEADGLSCLDPTRS